MLQLEPAKGALTSIILSGILISRKKHRAIMLKIYESFFLLIISTHKKYSESVCATRD